MLPDFGVRRALLLQSLAGPFFRRFAADLARAGVETTRITLNAGDALFHRGRGVVPYRGRFEDWPAFVRAVMRERGIDGVFLFGDGRPYHRAAIAVAREAGIPVWVFEEGYLRPDHITLEREGVNGFSSMPREPAFFLRAAAGMEAPPVRPVGATFARATLYSALYALAVTLAWWRYPHYTHHRRIHAAWQAVCWARAGWRRVWFAIRERGIARRLAARHHKKYFLVPLQVHCDFQLMHSRFGRIEEFIEQVVGAFAAVEKRDELLVIKHHPMDRPYREYGRFIRQLARRAGLEGRIVYVHDAHLPTLLTHARGTVTINSTVGLSSIHHGTPVKTLGSAVFDVPGLTFQGELGDFFRDPGAVDRRLYRAFRTTLLRLNQANGSFWKRLPGEATATAGACGVLWWPDRRSAESPTGVGLAAERRAPPELDSVRGAPSGSPRG